MTRTLEILRDLIAFPTVSRDSNLAMIHYIADFLRALNAEVRLIPSEDGQKANLYATFGPTDRPGVMLSGHTDVVPVDGQDWATDPFVMTRGADGRWAGRGTADMKGFIACCLAMAEQVDPAELKVPLHLAFSYDEEVGCLGVRRMIDILAELKIQPRFCLIGEPTSMGIAIGHKGKASLTLSCRGAEVHSSKAPLGVNAIHLAMQMVQGLTELQDRLAEGAGEVDGDIPYTTVHVGTIEGGTARNIVPRDCSMLAEIRHPADVHLHDIVAEVEAIAARVTAQARAAHPQFPDIGVSVSVTSSYPALQTDPDADVVTFIKNLLGANSHGTIAFGTEGGLFQQCLGLPTIVCGPGDIADAHKPDEAIDEGDLAACDQFLQRLLATLRV